MKEDEERAKEVVKQRQMKKALKKQKVQARRGSWKSFVLLKRPSDICTPPPPPNFILSCKIQTNKLHHKKVLLSSFHLNGHTLGFHPQTQTLEPPCTV